MPSATGSFALPAYLMRNTVWEFIPIASKRKPCSSKVTRPWTSFRGKTLLAAEQSNASRREDARLTTHSLLQKSEAILRRGGVFVDWRYGRETRFASWEFRTGKNMRLLITSRFNPRRTEVIHYERGSGILMTDRSSNCAQHS